MAESNTNPPSEEGLSKLPESILCHILSFATTKEAARTSVLSRQWQHIWTAVPAIDVNATDIRSQLTTFEQIIFKILLTRQQGLPITKVRLFCDSECDYVNLGYLLAALVTGNLQEFDLCIDHRSPVSFELPGCLWSCNTHSLVVLRLRGPIAIRVDSSSAKFPKLKLLHLNNVCFKGDGSVPNLLLSCPVLDELVIRNASNSATKVTLRSRALKRLTYDQHSSTAFAFENTD